MANGSECVLVDVTVAPRWELIGDLRRLIAAALTRLKADEALVSGVALAAHELLENAVKYGHGQVRLRIVLDEAMTRVTRVEVENNATPEQIARLQSQLRELHDAPDPMQHYTHLMARAAGQTGISGLGLARVQVEAEMNLSCVVAEGRVTAVAAPLATA